MSPQMGVYTKADADADIAAHQATLDAHTFNKYEKLVEGRYMLAYSGLFSTSSFTIEANKLYAIPFAAARAMTVDRIAFKVATPGAAGTKARLGIYNSGTEGEPTSLLLDAGTVPVDTETVKSIAIEQALSKGIYWLAAVSDGTPKVIRHYAMSTPYGIISDWTQMVSHIYVAHAFGALPDPFGTPDEATAEGIYISLRLKSLD